MKILRLTDYDLYLTYSWGKENHGVCGHTYEVIDYYNLLKNHINCAILLCEDITPDLFRATIREKYTYSENEIESILSNTVFLNRPTLLSGKNILFTDGEITDINIHVKLIFENVFLFGCGDKKIVDFNKKNYWILLDQRVYKTSNHFHYVKKIDFEHIKKPLYTDNKSLLYVTENCRAVDQNIIDKINGELLIISNYTNYVGDNITVQQPPIKDIFSRFNKYIYTPIARHWDCSPRFIAECKYLDIEVEYLDIDYLDEDLGLYFRKYDIENNFNSLYLKQDDSIINFIKEKI